MKRIEWICDRCKKVESVQLVAVLESIETHLHRVLMQEWCFDCLGHNGDYYKQNITPNKQDFVKSELEKEKYGNTK